MKYKNIADMFFQKKRDFPEKTAYQYKKDGQWVSLSFNDVVDMAEKLAAGFASLGIKTGDRISLISHNRYEWAITDYATQALGAILVPIYPSIMPDQVEYIVNDSESVIIIAEDNFQTDKVNEIQKNLKDTKHFIVIDPGDDPGLIIEVILEKDLSPIAVVNTHAHLDHIGGVSDLKEKYGIPFYLHPNEKPILDGYERDCAFFCFIKRLSSFSILYWCNTSSI